MEQTPHILFVEDDADIRSWVADFLTQNGYRMSVAREARELDRTLAVSRIDLLILDIMLPKEDGLSLCRRIRATSDIPIIMLTARGSEIDRVVGLEMGASGHSCGVPISPARLASTARRRCPFAGGSSIWGLAGCNPRMAPQCPHRR